MACIRKYRGSWVVDWGDPSGKRHIETVEGNRDSAERRLSEIVRTGKQAANKRLTFKEYGEWWLENCAKAQIKDSTFQEYKSVLIKHLYPLFGSRPLVKIGRSMVRELIAVNDPTSWRKCGACITKRSRTAKHTPTRPPESASLTNAADRRVRLTRLRVKRSRPCS